MFCLLNHLWIYFQTLRFLKIVLELCMIRKKQNYDSKVHHWSNNYNKGFYIYNKIDKLLDQCKLFEFTYIGRYNRDYTPKNIRLIKPMFGKELGDELRKHHIYVTASLNEPCGMHQLEGIAELIFRLAWEGHNNVSR